jgi:hypothetical protein
LPYLTKGDWHSLARKNRILESAFHTSGAHPTTMNLLRETHGNDKNYIEEDDYVNLLRLGTSFTEKKVTPFEFLDWNVEEDSDPGDDFSEGETNTPNKKQGKVVAAARKAAARAANKKKTSEMTENALVDNITISDKKGKKTEFNLPYRTHLERLAGNAKSKPRPAISSTTRTSPAITSIFVALGCLDLCKDKSETKATWAATLDTIPELVVCYLAQPDVNARKCHVGRLVGKGALLETALGKNALSLAVHDIVACLYQVESKGDAPLCARNIPMVPIGYIHNARSHGLSGTPSAVTASPVEVDRLWELLLDEKREDCFSLPETLNTIEKASVLFGALLERLAKKYQGLSDLKQWTFLHKRLRNYLWATNEEKCMKYVPDNINDLYHDVRVMMQSITTLRLSLIDGLGRVGAAIYALTGRFPERNAMDATMRVPEERRIQFCKGIYTRTGTIGTVRMVNFDNNIAESEHWDKDTVNMYREYSHILQAAYHRATDRSVHDCLYTIAIQIAENHQAETPPEGILHPEEFNVAVAGSNSEKQNKAWLTRLRKSVFEQIVNEISPNVVQMRTLYDQTSTDKKGAWFDHRYADKGLMTQKKLDPPEKLSVLMVMLTQYQFDGGPGDAKSISNLQDFLRYGGIGVHHAGDIGLPSRLRAQEMRGLFPQSQNGSSNNFDYTKQYYSLIHWPTQLLGAANTTSLINSAGSSGNYLKTKNLTTRYHMAAGSALLNLYNNLGPLLDMSTSLKQQCPDLWNLLRSNPFKMDSTKTQHVNSSYHQQWYPVGDHKDRGLLYSNIPTFVCLLTWIAMRSEMEEVPEEQRMFYFYKVPYQDSYKKDGSLRHSGTSGIPGGGWATSLSPLFKWKPDGWIRADDSRAFTLVEMADLLLNEDSKLWKEGPCSETDDEYLEENKKSMRILFNRLCGWFNWKNHFYEALGNIPSYVKFNTSKGEVREDVGVGYVVVKGAKVTTEQKLQKAADKKAKEAQDKSRLVELMKKEEKIKNEIATTTKAVTRQQDKDKETEGDQTEKKRKETQGQESKRKKRKTDERSDGEDQHLDVESDDEPVGGFGPGEAGGNQATVQGGGKSVVMEVSDKDKDHVFLPVGTGKKISVTEAPVTGDFLPVGTGKKISVTGAPVTVLKSLAQNAVGGETDEAAPGDVDEGGSDTKDPYPNPDHWDHPDHPDHKSGRLEDMVTGSNALTVAEKKYIEDGLTDPANLSEDISERYKNLARLAVDKANKLYLLSELSARYVSQTRTLAREAADNIKHATEEVKLDQAARLKEDFGEKKKSANVMLWDFWSRVSTEMPIFGATYDVDMNKNMVIQSQVYADLMEKAVPKVAESLFAETAEEYSGKLSPVIRLNQLLMVGGRENAISMEELGHAADHVHQKSDQSLVSLPKRGVSLENDFIGHHDDDSEED